MLLSATDHAAMLATLGDSYTLSLDGLEVGSIVGIFDAGGESVAPYSAEVVVTRPALTCLASVAASMTQRHTVRIGGVEYRPFGAPINSGDGLARQQLR